MRHPDQDLIALLMIHCVGVKGGADRNVLAPNFKKSLFCIKSVFCIVCYLETTMLFDLLMYYLCDIMCCLCNKLFVQGVSLTLPEESCDRPPTLVKCCDRINVMFE